MDTFTKQPHEELDYPIDLSKWMASGDTILSAVASVSPTGLTLGDTEINNGALQVVQWVSGGTDGIKYQVTVLITTANDPPRVKEVDFIIKVKEV